MVLVQGGIPPCRLAGTTEVSNDVGCLAMGAERISVGRVTGTNALLAAGTPDRAPQGRNLVPPSRH